MSPLHRLASNNLPVGAKMLLDAGVDVFNKGKVGMSPMSIAAQDSAAHSVMEVLKEAERKAEAAEKKALEKARKAADRKVMGLPDAPDSEPEDK